MLLHMYANYLGKNIHFCFHTPFNVIVSCLITEETDRHS